MDNNVRGSIPCICISNWPINIIYDEHVKGVQEEKNLFH